MRVRIRPIVGGWDPRGYKTTGPKEKDFVFVGIWTIPMRVLWLAEWKHDLSMNLASAHQIGENSIEMCQQN